MTVEHLSEDRDAGELLRITNLAVEFTVDGTWSQVLRGVDLHLQPGESLALVGESGSGKSVTAISVLGLLPKNARLTSGRIELHGRDLTALAPTEYRELRGSEIGFVFQDPQSSLNPVLTIGRQLTEQMRVHGTTTTRSGAERRAADLLERVGIPNPGASLTRYPFEFSGGMRQRISLAIALSCEPTLLIADEPTTALDVTVQAQVLDLLRELQQDLGVGMIFITHDLSVASIVADRVAVMYAGQVIESGPIEMVQNGRHPYTQGLWKAMPSLETRGIPQAIPGRPPTAAELPTGCAFGPRCGHFAALPCEQPQHMTTVGAGHTVRCARSEEL